MTITVDITKKSGDWDSVLTPSFGDYAQTIEKVCTLVYSNFDGGNAEVSVVLADNDFVAGLNQRYRNTDKPTNVLSFPASDGFGIDGLVEQLGDIIIALETVQCECVEQEKHFENHFVHLVLHGMLHLLGLDHIDPQEAEEMEALEIELLMQLGIEDPYIGTDIIG